jgi:hypothetical protein
MAAAIKINLGISALIKKLDEINERRKAHKNKFFLTLCDNLEEVDTIVSAFDNLFIDLAQGFSDRKIVNSNKALEKHVKATRDYLYGRNKVGRLVKLQGLIANAANNRRLRAKSGAPEKLSTLADKIQDYLKSINYDGPSGVGYQELSALTGMADQQLSGNVLANEIVAKANQAIKDRQFKHSTTIETLIGEAKALIIS